MGDLTVLAKKIKKLKIIYKNVLHNFKVTYIIIIVLVCKVNNRDEAAVTG